MPRLWEAQVLFVSVLQVLFFFLPFVVSGVAYEQEELLAQCFWVRGVQNTFQ